MKRETLFILLVAGLFLSLPACKKTQVAEQTLSTEEALTIMTDRAWNQMASEDLFPEDPSAGIGMRNDGISADFLLDETYLDDNQNQYGGNLDERIFIRDHSLIRCLRGLNLTEEQVPDVKRGLRKYEACKDHAVKRIRAIYRELKTEYDRKFHRLLRAYREGSITEREFIRKVKELRAEFRSKLLGMHLKEKLDAALKKCLREFLAGLKEVLTERQWNAFITCYTHP